MWQRKSISPELSAVPVRCISTDAVRCEPCANAIGTSDVFQAMAASLHSATPIFLTRDVLYPSSMPAVSGLLAFLLVDGRHLEKSKHGVDDKDGSNMNSCPIETFHSATWNWSCAPPLMRLARDGRTELSGRLGPEDQLALRLRVGVITDLQDDGWETWQL